MKKWHFSEFQAFLAITPDDKVTFTSFWSHFVRSVVKLEFEKTSRKKSIMADFGPKKRHFLSQFHGLRLISW